MKIEWRFTRRFWLMLLMAFVLASNVSFSTTRAATTNIDVMQARNFVWFGLPYVSQLKAYVVYDNGAGYWSGGGTWHWTRRPKVWKAGSFADCHMDGLVGQSLNDCGATRISRRKVEIYMTWKQEIKVLGIGMERSCWMRAYISTPDARITNRRWGGDC